MISSSSVLPNAVAFRPAKIDLPFSSLTLTKKIQNKVGFFLGIKYVKPKAAGPWQTAETTFPCFQNSSANLIFVLSSCKSKQGPWPPT